MTHLLGGVFLGWALGANDAANVFGTAVVTRVLRYTTATVLCALFVVLGALTEGRAGIETLGALSAQSLASATYTATGAAVAMTLMTVLGIPASASQAVVGSIVGIGLFFPGLNVSGLMTILLCWVGTPLGALLIAAVLYRYLGLLLNRLALTLVVQDVVLRALLVIVGCYGAYTLGANNVANVTAVYYAAGVLTPFAAALLGSLSIAAGVLTFSRPVMNAVGRDIVRLDAFSAVVVVLAEALTLHLYTWIGVPVSTSQAVVGAVVGVGLVKQASAVRGAVVRRIAIGWIGTPLIAAAVSVLLFYLTHLRFVAPS